jgi:hypothetical protein
MKPFDLQKFLAGEPITTLGGHQVVAFRYDTDFKGLHPLKVQIRECSCLISNRQYSIDGSPLGTIDSNYILCMKEPEIWINLFYDKNHDMPWLGVNRYKTEEEAQEHLRDHKWYQTSIKLKL